MKQFKLQWLEALGKTGTRNYSMTLMGLGLCCSPSTRAYFSEVLPSTWTFSYLFSNLISKLIR